MSASRVEDLVNHLLNEKAEREKMAELAQMDSHFQEKNEKAVTCRMDGFAVFQIDHLADLFSCSRSDMIRQLLEASLQDAFETMMISDEEIFDMQKEYFLKRKEER